MPMTTPFDVAPVFTRVRSAGPVPSAEQSFAVAERHGERPEAELVDQVMFEQRLDQPPAAVHLQQWPVLSLELGDPGGDIAADPR